MKFLSDITNRIPNPIYDFGRPKTPLSDAVFAMVFKTYSTFSGRRFATDMNWALEKGYIENKVPYNTMFDYFKNPALTPILVQMVTLTSLPLKTAETKFNIDSTGFGTSNFIAFCIMFYYFTLYHLYFNTPSMSKLNSCSCSNENSSSLASFLLILNLDMTSDCNSFTISFILTSIIEL